MYEARREVASASFRPLLSRMIKLHQLLEVRHLEAARLQECYASRLEGWAGRTDATTAVPTFIDAVASAIGTKSAGVSLVGEDGAESLVATSDHIARLAHDVEFVTGEGPAHDVAATMGTVRVDDSELTIRWPRFGAVVADLGVGSLIGVPLRQEPGGCLGALTVYDRAPVVAADTAATSIRVADAFIHTVLNLPGVVEDEQVPTVSLFDEIDFLATVHQAAGVVAAHLDCAAGDALALLRARAFADGMPVEMLARQVICGDLLL